MPVGAGERSSRLAVSIVEAHPLFRTALAQLIDEGLTHHIRRRHRDRRGGRQVANGGPTCPPALAGLLRDSARARQAGQRLALTRREPEVLALVAEGERDVDIARDMAISVRTVRSPLDRIREKTGQRWCSELTRLAIREGCCVGAPEPGEPNHSGSRDPHGWSLRAGPARDGTSRPWPAGGAVGGRPAVDLHHRRTTDCDHGQFRVVRVGRPVNHLGALAGSRVGPCRWLIHGRRRFGDHETVVNARGGKLGHLGVL